MQKRITKALIQHSFWLSIILHLLFLLSILAFIVLQPPETEAKKPPQYFVPAYTYRSAPQPIQQQAAIPSPTQAAPLESKEALPAEPEMAKPSQIEPEKSTIGTLPKKMRPMPKPIHKSLLASSLAMVQQEQLDAITQDHEQEPIYLIGDSSEAADPLIKLLGRSLSAHFRYPRMAGEFGIRGKTYIALTLHPEGIFSDVAVVKSSGNQDLDAAALYAVNSAPKVIGADHYITQAKHFVIGFVFY